MTDPKLINFLQGKYNNDLKRGVRFEPITIIMSKNSEDYNEIVNYLKDTEYKSHLEKYKCRNGLEQDYFEIPFYDNRISFNMRLLFQSCIENQYIVRKAVLFSKIYTKYYTDYEYKLLSEMFESSPLTYNLIDLLYIVDKSEKIRNKDLFRNFKYGYLMEVTLKFKLDKLEIKFDIEEPMRSISNTYRDLRNIRSRDLINLISFNSFKDEKDIKFIYKNSEELRISKFERVDNLKHSNDVDLIKHHQRVIPDLIKKEFKNFLDEHIHLKDKNDEIVLCFKEREKLAFFENKFKSSLNRYRHIVFKEDGFIFNNFMSNFVTINIKYSIEYRVDFDNINKNSSDRSDELKNIMKDLSKYQIKIFRTKNRKDDPCWFIRFLDNDGNTIKMDEARKMYLFNKVMILLRDLSSNYYIDAVQLNELIYKNIKGLM